jgi:hypothetical protein
VPDEARELFRRAIPAGDDLVAAWERAFDAYAAATPTWPRSSAAGDRAPLPDGWDGG